MLHGFDPSQSLSTQMLIPSSEFGREEEFEELILLSLQPSGKLRLNTLLKLMPFARLDFVVIQIYQQFQVNLKKLQKKLQLQSQSVKRNRCQRRRIKSRLPSLQKNLHLLLRHQNLSNRFKKRKKNPQDKHHQHQLIPCHRLTPRKRLKSQKYPCRRHPRVELQVLTNFLIRHLL